MITKGGLQEQIDDLKNEIDRKGGRHGLGFFIKPGLKKRVDNLEKTVNALLYYLEVETEEQSMRIVKKNDSSH